MKTKDWVHKEYPKICDPNDFWGQIKRTVDGMPVSDYQINLIVEAIKSGLSLVKEESFLDLGCGNGALSQFFFEECNCFLGVDFSSYLIDVAKKNFEKRPNFSFIEYDAATYVKEEKNPKQFTKVLCYGAFPYLTENDAETVISSIYERFVNVKKVFLGNLPDLDRIDNFYYKDIKYQSDIKDNTSSIGIWRSKIEIIEMVRKFGWNPEIKFMPKEYYAANYRYDVILTR